MHYAHVVVKSFIFFRDIIKIFLNFLFVTVNKGFHVDVIFIPLGRRRAFFSLLPDMKLRTGMGEAALREK